MDHENEALEKDESWWIFQAQQGNAHAFAVIVEQYQNAVYGLCYRMLGNPGDAEDAAQEVFLRAFRALNRYDNNRKFSTWILSIASNYCIDQLRKRRFLTLSLDIFPYLPAHTTTPETTVIQDERQRSVQQLLQVLNGKDRACVILRYWYDYSYDEIADTLSLTNSAVKSRLHRARKSLAEEWTQQQEAQILPVPRSSYETQTI